MMCRSHLLDFSATKKWTFLHALVKAYHEMTVNTASQQTLTKIMSSVLRGIICQFNFAHLSRPLLHVKGIKL